MGPFELLLMASSLVKLKILHHLHVVLVVVLWGFLLLVLNYLLLFGYLKILLLADWVAKSLIVFLTIRIE